MALAVANAARLGVGLGAVCADVVESLNAVLKPADNVHTDHGRRGRRGLQHWISLGNNLGHFVNPSCGFITF